MKQVKVCQSEFKHPVELKDMKPTLGIVIVIFYFINF